MTPDDLEDYKTRLAKAAQEIDQMGRERNLDRTPAGVTDAIRLAGKAQGIRLALDYLRGYQ